MNKQVHRYKDIRAKILKGVDTIADPIKETISPKGRNVLFENERGDIVSTNDGVTIAKSITVEDPIEDAIISVIKSAAFRSNTEAGDGTSTSILLSSLLIKEGFKLIDNGWNQMDVKRSFEQIRESILSLLDAKRIKIKSDKELRQIAYISANSDDKIADDVVKVVKVVGEDGMVFLEKNNKNFTEIEEDNGFIIEQGLWVPELRNNPKAYAANHQNVPVLITDKRIYYPEEAETIIKTVLMAGHKAVVVVARDFIGQAPNVFIANHAQGVCQVLMVKEPRVTEKDTDALHDLALYLGGEVVSEKSGSLVNNLTIEQFATCDKAFADGVKTILTSKVKKNKKLQDRIAMLKKELDKDKNDEGLKKRIASLTNGMVTIKVGGETPIEIQERAFRYEDAVHAARAAMKDGYLVGGGVTMLSLRDELPFDGELQGVVSKVCEANLRQIAENCGVHAPTVIENVLSYNLGTKGSWKVGFNANTESIEDLLKAGVVDPYKVTEMAVRNSFSVAIQVISSNFLILHEGDTDEDDDKKKD